MIELGDISCTYAHVGRSLRIRLWSRRRRHLFCGHAEERARIMLSRIVPSFSVFMADKTLAYSPRLRLGLYARVLSAIKISNSGTILYIVHTISGGSPVILCISLGGKPKWLY